MSEWNGNSHGTAVLLAFFLGSLFGFGTGLCFFGGIQNVDIGLFMIALSIFHLWEFLYVALFHPKELNTNCFMLNHSVHYHSALALGLSEYFLERIFFSPFKSSGYFLLIGSILTFGGQFMRTLAMYTAGSNFHHSIRRTKEDDHRLVTTVIYNYLRHPSYFGWFWWSIGTQVILINPISIIAYAVAGWTFFSTRIATEEKTLIKFFGEDYIKYKQRTIVGIPLI